VQSVFLFECTPCNTGPKPVKAGVPDSNSTAASTTGGIEVAGSKDKVCVHWFVTYMLVHAQRLYEVAKVDRARLTTDGYLQYRTYWVEGHEPSWLEWSNYNKAAIASLLQTLPWARGAEAEAARLRKAGLTPSDDAWTLSLAAHRAVYSKSRSVEQAAKRRRTVPISTVTIVDLKPAISVTTMVCGCVRSCKVTCHSNFRLILGSSHAPA
jgi:hypothetical protein